jgi:DNA-binding NarL/FixJ family response regulator
MKTIKIAIADDHQLFREGLTFIIQQQAEFELIIDAQNGIDLLEKLQQVGQLPDVILMDIKMPQMDGMECTSKIKTLYPQIKIIILTMYDQEDFILHLLDLGVNGYLLKQSSAQEVKKAIIAVVEKDYYFDEVICQVMLRGLKKKKAFKPKMDENIQITSREKEILDLIFKEYTTNEIADKLFLSVRTVETHRKNILEKFGAKNTAGLVIKAINLGLLSLNSG